MGARGFVGSAVVGACLLASSVRADDEGPKLTAADRDYDQIDLLIDVALDLEQGTVAGTATHSLAALRDDFRVVRMHCEDVKIESATADGAACQVAQEKGLVSVTLDRPRKKKRRKGKFKPCPKCGATGAKRVNWTAWGSFYGPSLFTHVRCPECDYCYNGKTGGSNLGPAILMVSVPLLLILGIIGGVLYMLKDRGWF